MNLGSIAERTMGTVDLDPMVEFREGVELLKNEYPPKSTGEIAACFRKRQT